jgi:hypothetical protein
MRNMAIGDEGLPGANEAAETHFRYILQMRRASGLEPYHRECGRVGKEALAQPSKYGRRVLPQAEMV